MADLSRMAITDGSSGLVPFLARASADSGSRSEGRSFREGRSGAENLQSGDDVSSGTSETATRNEGIHQTSLMALDDVAGTFDRTSGLQLVLLSNKPVALRRTFTISEKVIRDGAT